MHKKIKSRKGMSQDIKQLHKIQKPLKNWKKALTHTTVRSKMLQSGGTVVQWRYLPTPLPAQPPLFLVEGSQNRFAKHIYIIFNWFFGCSFDSYGRNESLLRLWEDLRRKRNGNVKSDAAITLLYVCAPKAFSALTSNLHIFLLFF
jgi:hypothetical protein